jgi:iron-sulfur cluster insertion protein
MSAVQSFEPQQLRMSARASAKVRELVVDEANPELKLRVYVTGGGCAGFQYGFSFEETIADDDTVIEADGAAMVVDALSFPYLTGSEVDYVEGLEGSRFTVRNPNATTTCGCGSSFSV